MKKLYFSIDIDAPRNVVWNSFTNPETYKEWATVFQEGSFYEGGWNTGDKILFLMTNAEGNKEGMLSYIDQSIPNEFVSIKHVGFVQNGIEDTESDEVKKWAPAFEKYTLVDKNGATRFDVDIDVDEQWEEYMANAWPPALEVLKKISERQA